MWRATAVVALLLATACGSSDRSAGTTAQYDCPTTTTAPSIDPGPEIAFSGDRLTSANYARAAYGLRAATLQELTTPEARLLYRDLGVHILPEEADAWRSRVALMEKVRLVLDQLSADPSFGGSSIDNVPPAWTVWIRDDGVARAAAATAGLPVTIISTTFSQADGQAELDRILGQLDAEDKEGLGSWGVESDGLRIAIDCTNTRRSAIASAIADAHPSLPYAIVGDFKAEFVDLGPPSTSG